MLLIVSDRFQWVFFQLDTLRRSMPSSLRKVLDELPTNLDDTYERALQGIHKEKRQHAHRLFQCLVAAVRPLRIEELAEIFAIEFDSCAAPNLMEAWRPENPEAILSTASTLITVIEDEGSRIVQFSHFSVKEFLTSERLRTSGFGSIRDYYISLDVAHITLARACLTVLLHLDDKMDKRRLARFPLAFYAARHWVDHAQLVGVAPRIQGLMEDLFDPCKPQLAAWVWIYNVELPTVQPSIHTLPDKPSRPQATALYYAALCGFSGLVKYLVRTHSEDVNAKCGLHGTPLHAASYMGHLDTARALLDNGADANSRNNLGRTPFGSACDGGHPEFRSLLLEYGVDVNASDNANHTPVYEASTNGHPKVVPLLDHGADPNA